MEKPVARKVGQVTTSHTMTVWDRLRSYAEGTTGSFTSQEAISWFHRHSPGQVNDRTVRSHLRGACCNVENRHQFSSREPFLTRVGHGTFRTASEDEIGLWRRGLHQGDRSTVGQDVTVSWGIADIEPEWHSEALVQRTLVSWLERDGWTVIRQADTASGEHGVDVVAERHGVRLGIEVKGYPSKYYARGPKKGQLKPTRPNAQAPKWFAHALVPAMRLRTNEPDTRSVICFPDFPVYRRLYQQTGLSLRVAGIETWVVREDGEVEVL